MAKNLIYNKLIDDESSFQLVRTNPKLTGNVKLTINESGDMWLNSIDANDELAKDQYKRFAIDPSVSLPVNIYRFFNNGQTPNEIVFDLNEKIDLTKTSTDYKDQFNFSNYFSGAKYLISKRYDERFSYFAPIYLKKQIPDYFIIFKIKDPLNKPIDQLKLEYPYNKEQYLKDMFKKASIIKTFDIGPNSKIGKYLRDYINDPLFPTSSLYVSFEKDTFTSWNGILLNSGVFGSKSEILSDFYSTSYPLKFFEENITLGFERNGVIYPNILNLEFIFNDDQSKEYEFNRYFGAYVNAIQLSNLEIDLDRAYNERSIWENEFPLKRKYYFWEEASIKQKNENGVIFPYSNSEINISEFESIFKDKENFYFNYIKDKNNKFYLPKLDEPYSIDYDSQNNELSSGKIRLSNNLIDFGNFFGPSKIFLQDKGFSSKLEGFSFQYLKIKNELSHLDYIKIYHPHGTKIDSFGKYDELIGVENYSLIPNPGDYYYYHDIDNIVGYDIYYFNNKGSVSEIASAISNCLNKIRNRTFKSYQYKDTIIIKCSVAGDYDNNYYLEFYSSSNNYLNIIIGDIENSDLVSNKIQFEGGSISNKNNRLVLDSGHFLKIKSNIDKILVKTIKGWSPIFKISKYVDLFNENNFTTDTEKQNALNSFFNKIVITLKLDEDIDISYGDFIMRYKTFTEFGLFSFFPIKDFDFDFYSSTYSNFPIIDLYNYYYIPEKLKMIVPGYKYKVVGNGSILINGFEYSSNSEFILPYSSENYYYERLSGNAFVTFSDDITTIGSRLDIPINDENKELKDFSGFFILKDPDKIIEETNNLDFQLKEKYLNGITNTEYDFYKENYSKDFSLKSKIIPYITKWSIKDGKDSRDNPYRLNTELVFGFNNFSPNHEDFTQNPSNFTHEWFYIESAFNYLNTEETIKNNLYYFDNNFDLNLALTDPNYFINYFTYIPTFNGKQIGPPQMRYSPIIKNKIGEYETFFKGFRILFRDVLDNNSKLSNGKPIFNKNSLRFEGYKFSILLKPIKEDINDDKTPPIRYRFIEHKTFKFILLLIEVNFGSIDQIDDIWKQVSNFSPSLEKVSIKTSTDFNGNFLDTIYTGDNLYKSINGDYRISFNQNGVSNLTYCLLYSLKNKKYNNWLNAFSNIKLSYKLDISPSGVDLSSKTINAVKNLNILNYPFNASDEIINPKENNLLIIRNSLIGLEYFLDNVLSYVPQFENKIFKATENLVLFDSNNLMFIDQNAVPSYSFPIGIPFNFINQNFIFKILSGGERYYETLIQKISFGYFKKCVNELNPFIEYYSYEYFNNSLIQIQDSKLYTEIPSYNSIIKKDAIVTKIDLDKPSRFSFNNIIGFSYERFPLDNYYEINRYSGEYEPIFKEVSKFYYTFDFIKNDINSLNFSNIKFNIDIDKFMTIENFNHIKISEDKILDLESDPIYKPQYELLNEISIGRENYFLFLSNWDYGFHYKYFNKNNYSSVPGTLRIEEDDCFISKLIIVPNEIKLENFNIKYLKDIEKLEDIDLSKIEMIVKENSKTVEGFINLNNILINYFLSSGFINKFNEFLNNSIEFIGKYSSLEDYIKDYIKLNILKLYDISLIEFYTKKDSTILTSKEINNEIINGIVFDFLNDKQRLEKGYLISKNLKINKFDRLILKFSFNKGVNSGIRISPKIKINLI